MARGQAGKADKQLGITNTAAAGYGNLASGIGSQLTGEAGKLINSTGFDPATLAAITNAGMGGVNAAFGSAADQVARTAATSKNPAAVGALEDAFARDKGVAAGKEAGDIQIQNAMFKAEQQKQGRDILSNLYGTDVGAQTGLYGMGPSTLGARAAGGGWTQGFKDVMGALKFGGGSPAPAGGGG
jgi:hypothetical protein